MSIKEYIKKDESGKSVKLYQVRVEAINEYTGRRMQKQESGIGSKQKAQKREKELWFFCKKEHPVLPQVRNWGVLKEHYLDSSHKNIRNESNPNGIGQRTFWNKKSSLGHLKEVLSKKYQKKGLKTWDDLHLDLITPQFLNDELNALVLSETGI